MELRLLGPLEVVSGNGPVPIPAGKPRALLILLALHANEAVSVDQIVEALWGEVAPASAPAIVQTYVSRLRKLLGDQRIDTIGRGYRLQLSAGERDIDRAEQLRARSRSEPPPEAARSLREAIALFRGQPLADVIDSDFAQAEARHLEELRTALVTEHIEADLAAGRHADVLGELERLVSTRPLDERLRGLLILALYRSGRQADALSAYQAARRALTEELGLEPSEDLRTLQRRVLEHDPSLELPSPRRPASTSARWRNVNLRNRRLVIAAVLAYTALVVAAGIAAGVAISNKDDVASRKGIATSPNSVAVIDPDEYRVVASVRVGLRPRFVAATTGSVWVAAVESRSVAQVDSRTLQVRATIDLGFEPTDIEAVGESVWVVGGYDRVLWRIDPDADVGLRLKLGEDYGPSPPGLDRGRAGLASSDAGLWLAFGDKVTLLDPVSGQALREVDLGSGWLQDIDVGAQAIVESLESGRIYNFDPYTSEIGESLDTGTDVSAILVASGYGWIAKRAARQLWQVNETDVALRRTIEVDGQPTALAFLDDAVWVVTQGSSFLRRIDARDGRVEASMELKHTPEGIAAANDLLWVSMRTP